MKRSLFLAALVAILTTAFSGFAHAGSISFSDDHQDYQLFVQEEGDSAKWIFYGIIEGDVTPADAEKIKLNYAALTPIYEDGVLTNRIYNLDADGEKIEFEIELDGCELLNEAKSGYGFRCFGPEFDLNEVSVIESIGIFHMDFSHLQFELGGTTSEWLWGRPFYMDVDCALKAEDEEEENECIAKLNDSDDDFVPDHIDNCVNDPNFDQLDSDGDGSGDLCDTCEGKVDTGIDTDWDGVDDDCDICPNDHWNECDAATGGGDDDGADDDGADDDGGADDSDITNYDGDFDDELNLEFGGANDISGTANADGADEAEQYVSGCVLAQGTSSSINYFGVILIAVGLLQIVAVRRKR